MAKHGLLFDNIPSYQCD